jgi:hypothetical protein
VARQTKQERIDELTDEVDRRGDLIDERDAIIASYKDELIDVYRALAYEQTLALTALRGPLTTSEEAGGD